MIVIKQNIGNADLTLARAKAEAGYGDPRGFSKCKKKDADIKVVLKSRPYADNKLKQRTFYLKRK